MPVDKKYESMTKHELGCYFCKYFECGDYDNNFEQICIKREIIFRRIVNGDWETFTPLEPCDYFTVDFSKSDHPEIKESDWLEDGGKY